MDTWALLELLKLLITVAKQLLKSAGSLQFPTWPMLRTQVLQAALAQYWSLAIVDLRHSATPIHPQNCRLRIVQLGQSCRLQLLDHLNLPFLHLSVPLQAFHRLRMDF